MWRVACICVYGCECSRASVRNQIRHLCLNTGSYGKPADLRPTRLPRRCAYIQCMDFQGHRRFTRYSSRSLKVATADMFFKPWGKLKILKKSVKFLKEAQIFELTNDLRSKQEAFNNSEAQGSILINDIRDKKYGLYGQN